jgi:hypothetical protein
VARPKVLGISTLPDSFSGQWILRDCLGQLIKARVSFARSRLRFFVLNSHWW